MQQLEQEAMANSPGKYDLRLDETLSAFFSKGVPAVNSFLVLSFVGKMVYHHELLPIGLSCSIVYLACLVVSFFIHMWMINPFCNLSVESRWKVAYLSTIFRMLAAAALLLFVLDSVLFKVMLVVIFLVLALVAYLFWQAFRKTDGDRDGTSARTPIGRNWKDHKEELELRFGMSAEVVSMAFGGLSGQVLGNVKGSSNLTGGVTSLVVAPECLFFYSAILSLIVVLLCTVPPRICNRRDRESMATVYIPIMAYTALSFLVLSSVIAAQGIMQEYHVVFVCLAFGVVMFYCRVMDLSSGPVIPETNRPADGDIRARELRESFGKYSQYIVPAYFTSVFLTLMVSRSMYGTGSGSTVPLSWWFQGFVLSAVCSILSYATLIVLLAEMRNDTTKWEKSRNMVCYVTCATTPATIVFVILVWFLQPEVVKSIL